jgi:hypothetical protein
MLTKHTHVSQFTPPPARASLPYLARPSVAFLHDLYGLATVHSVFPMGVNAITQMPKRNVVRRSSATARNLER